MQQRYSLGAIILHWLIAALLAFQLSVGLGLEHLGPSGFALYQLHKSLGIAVLALTLLRIGWRLIAPRPPALEHGWQGRLASAVHLGLYVFMLGAPVTGWLLVSTDRVKVPTLLFGTLAWPHLPAPAGLNGFAHVSHALLGWLGILLVVLHVAGALRHQWLLRDPVMLRMSPGRTAWPVLLLSLVIPIAWGLGVAALSQAGAGRDGGGEAGGVGAEGVGAGAPTRPAPVAPEAPPVKAAAAAEATPRNEAAADPAAAPAPVPRWTIQPGGKLAFAVDNGGMRIEGRFATWSGEIAFDPERPEQADIRISVDLGSATVGDATQDQMLASADFLDAAAHPRATYRAAAARLTAPGRYSASGTLNLRGISRPQTVRFTLTGAGASRHVEGSATIPRAPYGIGTGTAGGTLGPEVTLRFSFDARTTAQK